MTNTSLSLLIPFIFLFILSITKFFQGRWEEGDHNRPAWKVGLNNHWCCVCTCTVFALELDDNKPEWMVDSEPWYHQYHTALTPISHWNLASIWQISPITCEKEKSRCTSSHTGTSASSPMAAGIIALVLEVNLVFIWKIHQYITTLTPISCQYLGLLPSSWR